jgi:hypothetical protein
MSENVGRDPPRAIDANEELGGKKSRENGGRAALGTLS